MTAVIAPAIATPTAERPLTIFFMASAQASACCPTSSACIILEYHTCFYTKNFFLLSYFFMVAEEKFDELPTEMMGERYDPFEDDTPIECGLENPEVCESCQ
jgi:hypothetical protein